MEISSQAKRLRHSSRSRRTRMKLRAGESLPRLSVFRSGRHIYAQIIDDAKGITLAFASDIVGKKGAAKKDTKRGVESASHVGESIAKLAIEKKINAVVFDRGGYRYHGRVRALADAARKAGLKF